MYKACARKREGKHVKNQSGTSNLTLISSTAQVSTDMGKAQKHFSNRPEIDFSPKTQQQAELFYQLKHNNLVVALGPAGTGKTYTCCMQAAMWLTNGNTHKIVIARANVPTGRSLGAVPGTLEEKLEPWTMPMTDVLKRALGRSLYEYHISKANIEPVAIETIRGRSFDNAVILIDEAQQLNMDEIKAITTRIGENSVLVLMGDPKQSDIKGNNALLNFVDLIDRHDPDGCIALEFGMEDIVRSDTCAQMVKMFYKEGL